MMNTRLFLRLSDGWALAYDSRQWVVQKRRGRGWHPVAFVASTRRALLNTLREAGAEVNAEARDALNDLPSTFGEWIATRDRVFPKLMPEKTLGPRPDLHKRGAA